MFKLTGVAGNKQRRLRRRAAAAAVAAALLGALAAPAAGQTETAQPGLADVAAGAYYAAAVESLHGDSVFAGTLCQEGFCGDEAIDRKTLAVWMVRVLDGADPAPVTESSFADVDAAGFHSRFVERLVQLGVTQGCADGTNFCPDDHVTRAQMAVFLSRAFNLPDAADPNFADVAAGAWYRTAVAKLAASGITAGCGDGSRFCPQDPTTRAQMAVFLARATGQIPTPQPQPDVPVVGFTFHWPPEALNDNGQIVSGYGTRRASIDTSGTLHTLNPLHHAQNNNIYTGHRLRAYFPESGTRIAYLVHQSELGLAALHLASADGTRNTEVSLNAANASWSNVNVTWSPGGTGIAYTVYQEYHAYWWLFVTDPEGTTTTRIADELHRIGEVFWSPDGTRIAYPDAGLLFVANADGTNPTRIADGDGDWRIWGWSPDSTRIAYTVDQEDNTASLFVASADGTNPTRIADGDGDSTIWGWSPDGTRIAYTVDQEDNTASLFVASADGTNPTRIADELTRIGELFWSPDGARIAYTDAGCSRRPSTSTTCSLFVASADGTNPTRIADELTWIDDEVFWSPDGARIAYTEAGSLFVTNGDSDATTRISDKVNYRPYFSTSPGPVAVWSPDGARIAYKERQEDRTVLFVANNDGAVSEVTSQTDSQSDDTLGAEARYDVWWSPDGRFVSYSTYYDLCSAGGWDGHCFALEPIGFGLADRDGGNHRFLQDAVSLAWSPDSTRFASLISNDSAVKLVIEDIATGEQSTRFDVALDLPELCGRWTTWTTAGIHPNRLPECAPQR